ncbi:MAG: NAD-dependent epimerase/dehydratase family protein [Planctomycetes bacterium]|nr:NAD-dependent epimerase/dehydratase family protein [Planctomycetota bacterium]
MSTERETSRTPTVSSARPEPGADGASARRRVAIVGAGYIADYHVPILQSLGNVDVVAIVDSHAPRADALAKRFGIARVLADVKELADLSVDVVHLLTPPDTHAALTRLLLEMGVGVFVEKPFVLSTSESRELEALAAKKGAPLGVNHNNTFHPAWTRLLARLRSGEIGRVEHVQVTWNVPLAQLDAFDYSHWMFRAPRNIVFEQAVHPFGQVHQLLGRVKCASTTILSKKELHPGQTFVDRWSISAVGERGTAQIYLAFGQGFTRSTVQVIGSDGTLEADLQHNTLTGEEKTVFLDFWNSYLAGVRRAKSLKRDARRGLVNWLRFTLGFGKREDAFFVGMRESIRDFHAALDRREAPANGGREATEVLEWCEASVAGVPVHGAREPELPAPGPARPGEVVVLGATGFIGQRTVAKLLAAGKPVTIVARRAHSLPSDIVAAAQDGRVRFLRGSLEDPKALHASLAGAHGVIQLATGGGDTWEKVERSMVQGSVDVARAAIAHGVKRFVYVSSVAALYTGGSVPGGVIDDSTATDPKPELRPIYSRGKIAAEKALLELHEKEGLPLVIARPGIVLGAGTAMQHSGYGLWTRDNHCIGWGKGDAPIPGVWVDDVADALARIVTYPKDDLHGEALNLCAQPPITPAEYVNELGRVTGRALYFHPRSLWVSQAMEIGKWLVKKAGRRSGLEFPSWRDLDSRGLTPRFTARLAREKLAWKPVEEREAFLDRCVRVYRRDADSH